MSYTHHFHQGELFLQQQSGQSDFAQRVASAIRDTIADGAHSFIAQQSMLITASIDAAGMLWSSVMFGAPGFIHAVSAKQLHLDTSQLIMLDNDPVWRNIHTNADIGLLLIEFENRRRLRINGKIKPISEDNYFIEVEQCYGNCPRYIQRRRSDKIVSDEVKKKPQSGSGSELNQIQQNLISHADTLFVASAHPKFGADASHRGGQPGFVQFIDSRTLQIEDYAGNGMFNTLGNIVQYPYAGLSFIDFNTAGILQLSGKAQVILETGDRQSQDTRRHWQFEIEQWREHKIIDLIQWQFLEASPHNPPLP